MKPSDLDTLGAGAGTPFEQLAQVIVKLLLEFGDGSKLCEVAL